MADGSPSRLSEDNGWTLEGQHDYSKGYIDDILIFSASWGGTFSACSSSVGSSVEAGRIDGKAEQLSLGSKQAGIFGVMWLVRVKWKFQKQG